MFASTSRYFNLPTQALETPDGEVVYVLRRFCPQPDRLALIQEHVVQLGDRLDNVTAHYLDDAEQFWRIADANAALRPEELVECVGRRLRITLPEGVPGVPSG